MDEVDFLDFRAPTCSLAARLVIRLLALLAAIAIAAPARADDISAAARGVVRVVTIAVVDEEVVGFGHGSGFAVAPDHIVTNAHVVEAAARYPGNVLISIVPSEGAKAYQGRIMAVDPARDLALIAILGTRLPPLTAFSGGVSEGEQVVALGYPGNVDLATARSAADYITPLSPIRSQGVFSGRRSLMGTEVVLHTASIARGNSGGPLLDRCGRVIGVNSALTRGQEGDASFAFAIADRALFSFLREAGQPYQVNGEPCTTIEQRLEESAAAEAREAAEAADRAERRAAATLARRSAAIAEAREQARNDRENAMALAALLLVAGALAAGAAGVLEIRGRRRPALAVLGVGVILLGASVVVFMKRPEGAPDLAEPLPVPSATPPAATGPMTCRLVPERSRVTVSSSADVPFRWGASGCVNGRTQYARSDRGWRRVLVPTEEQTVSVLEYDPVRRRYVNTRYLLSATDMESLRQLRAAESDDARACTTDPAALDRLAARQAAILGRLPPLPNERLVYDCRPVQPGEGTGE